MLVFCIFRPHRIHSMRMWPPVATDKIAWSVWLLATTVSRAKTAEPIQMLSVVWTPGDPDSRSLRGKGNCWGDTPYILKLKSEDGQFHPTWCVILPTGLCHVTKVCGGGDAVLSCCATITVATCRLLMMQWVYRVQAWWHPPQSLHRLHISPWSLVLP